MYKIKREVTHTKTKAETREFDTGTREWTDMTDWEDKRKNQRDQKDNTGDRTQRKDKYSLDMKKGTETS